MKLTDISNPDYFHKVVDCQWACPAHTPVTRIHPVDRRGPLRRRLHDQLAFQRVPRISRAHLRPAVRARLRGACASRMSRVAICRLKRVASDYKEDIRARLPKPAKVGNGKRIAPGRRRPGPRSRLRATLPRTATPVWCFDQDPKAGGMMRSQIPKFRLPDAVIDEECGYILDLGIEFHGGRRIDSLKKSAGGRLGRGVRRLRRAARPRPSTSPAARRRQRTSTSASTGFPASRSATSTRSASA